MFSFFHASATIVTNGSTADTVYTERTDEESLHNMTPSV